jgi:hypothetical protein
MLLLLNGQIAGISGIAGNLLKPPDSDTSWRALFIIGLLLDPVLYRLILHHWPMVSLDANGSDILKKGKSARINKLVENNAMLPPRHDEFGPPQLAKVLR